MTKGIPLSSQAKIEIASVCHNGLSPQEASKVLSYPLSTIQKYFPQSIKHVKKLVKEKSYFRVNKIKDRLGLVLKLNEIIGREKYLEKHAIIKELFGNLIEHRMDKLHLTQMKFAKKIDPRVTKYTLSGIWRYCAGERMPLPSIQPKVFKALEMPHQTENDLRKDILENILNHYGLLYVKGDKPKNFIPIYRCNHETNGKRCDKTCTIDGIISHYNEEHIITMYLFS